MKIKNILYLISISIYSLVSLKIDDFLERYIKNTFITILVSVIIFVIGISLINKIFEKFEDK